jgi:hypothetical protein
MNYGTQPLINTFCAPSIAGESAVTCIMIKSCARIYIKDVAFALLNPLHFAAGSAQVFYLFISFSGLALAFAGLTDSHSTFSPFMATFPEIPRIFRLWYAGILLATVGYGMHTLI